MNKAQKLGFFAFTLIFTLALCGVATATAADSNFNDTNSTTLNSSETTTLHDPQIWRGGSYVADYTTIAAAIAAAKSGDTIMLENGATFLEHDLTISKNLDFKVLSGGHATIDAEKKGSIFDINQGVTVNLYNLTLQNANGAIISWGTLTTTNCTFQNNEISSIKVKTGKPQPAVAGVDGGAIANLGW